MEFEKEDYEPIKVGLASYGMSGKVFHAPLIRVNPHFILKKVLKRRSPKITETYNEVEVVKTFEDLLNDKDLELLVINTPNALHFEMVKEALVAGKHVIVEKPFTPTAREAKILMEIAKEQNRVLTVFHNRRWDGDFLTLRKIVSEKLLGNLVEYEAHYDRYVNHISENNWKEMAGPGSGTLYNLGSHMIDQALILFGKPIAITADLGRCRKNSKIDDYYTIILGYHQLKVILRSSYLVKKCGPRYILHGTKGSFVKFGMDPQEEALKRGAIPSGDEWGKESEKMWGELDTERYGMNFTGRIETLPGDYSEFYNNVFEAIRKGKELEVKAEEATQVIEIIEFAIQSSKEKRTIYI